jgi:ribonuclease P protein component
VLASPLRHPRIGFIIPKYGHSAVDRNRLKRRLREIIRLRVLGTLTPLDAVVKAQPSAYRAAFGVLAQELTHSMAIAEQRLQ